MTEITLPAVTDAHVHLRQGPMVSQVAGYSRRVCGRVIAMPNLTPPVADGRRYRAVHDEYQRALDQALAGDGGCHVHLTAKLLPTTSVEDVEELARLGAVGFKLYPAGATTNSDDGIPAAWLRLPPPQFVRVLRAIQDADLALLCHGEMPDSFCLDREAAFLRFATFLYDEFPGLRWTWEHLTTKVAVDYVLAAHRAGRKVLGTITAHHLHLTLDDVVGDKVRPDHFCKPLAKTPADRDALVAAATGGEKCFAFGSDSAPHAPETKYCAAGCAGVYSAPVMVETVMEAFAPGGRVSMWFVDVLEGRLRAFLRDNADRFYRFPPVPRSITLVPDPWTVPDICDGVVPYRAGQTLPWRVKE